MALSRLTNNAARQAGRAQRAFQAQQVNAARSAAGIGIDAAREATRLNSYTAPTNVLTASDAGDGTATIHVIEHTRVYPVQGGIKVDDLLIEAMDIPGQPLATVDLLVYYADESLADTTPALLVTDDPAVSAPGAGPGIHLIGKVTTPAAGAGNTTGSGGSTPPGGGGFKDIDHSTL